MIVRRGRRTRNFTVVGNEIMDDMRLTEALGVLCYLLSRPDDWHISLDQLQRRFGCGRDKMQGMMRSLRDCGYARLVALNDPETGKVCGKAYVINDEPEPQDVVDEEPARTARAGRKDAHREPEKPVVGEDATESLKNRPSEKPTVGKPGSILRTDLLPKTEEETKPPYPQGGGADASFEEFAKAYPLTPVMSRETAVREWRALAADEQRSAIDRAPAYRSACAAANRRMCDASTYLRQRRWAGFATMAGRAPHAAGSAGGQVFIERGTEAWTAWETHLRDRHRHPPGWRLFAFDSTEHRKSGCYQASLWPPPSACPMREQTGESMEQVLERTQQ